MRNVAAVVVALALAACSTAPPPQHGFTSDGSLANPPADVWIVYIVIDQGTPRLSWAHRSDGDCGGVAPCSPAEYVRDAHRARLPEPTDTEWDRLHTRDAVVEMLDARGEVLCRRIVPVTVELPLEAPPAPGSHNARWVIAPLLSFNFAMSIPRDEPFAAFRVSGWRGVQAKTFTAGELRQFAH